MNFEVVEMAGEWIVRREGAEVGRFAEQAEALRFVAQTMRGRSSDGAASLAMHFERRSA